MGGFRRWTKRHCRRASRSRACSGRAARRSVQAEIRARALALVVDALGIESGRLDRDTRLSSSLPCSQSCTAAARRSASARIAAASVVTWVSSRLRISSGSSDLLRPSTFFGFSKSARAVGAPQIPLVLIGRHRHRGQRCCRGVRGVLVARLVRQLLAADHGRPRSPCAGRPRSSDGSTRPLMSRCSAGFWLSIATIWPRRSLAVPVQHSRARGELHVAQILMAAAAERRASRRNGAVAALAIRLPNARRSCRRG